MNYNNKDINKILNNYCKSQNEDIINKRNKFFEEIDNTIEITTDATGITVTFDNDIEDDLDV